MDYFAALMAVQADDTDKLVAFIEDAKRTHLEEYGQRIEILPPDVNYSDADFIGVRRDHPLRPARHQKRRQGPD